MASPLEEWILKVGLEGAEDVKAAISGIGVTAAESFAKIATDAIQGNFIGLAAAINPVAGALVALTHAVYEFVSAQEEAISSLANLQDAAGLTDGELLGLEKAFASVG